MCKSFFGSKQTQKSAGIEFVVKQQQYRYVYDNDISHDICLAWLMVVVCFCASIYINLYGPWSFHS